MDNIKLSNGIEMPQLGYGVYQVTPEELRYGRHQCGLSYDRHRTSLSQ